MSLERAYVSSESPFLLSMHGPGKKAERLGIRSEYEDSELSRTIYASLALMYLVSPYLPAEITTDFFVPHAFQVLIGSMYEAEGRQKPAFSLTDRRLARHSEPYFGGSYKHTGKSVLTYSGGKDTLWNLDWLLRENGAGNVLAVHYRRINTRVFAEELEATMAQQGRIGFPLEIVDLLNSSSNKGKSIMRARDMGLVGWAVPMALSFGASDIVLEGGYSKYGSAAGEPFTTYESSWRLFNSLLDSLGIPVRAAWRDTTGIQAVSDIITRHPDWLPLVYNCFKSKFRKKTLQEYWKRVAPTFPFYPKQCGSCVKCRELTIARIAYDPSVLQAKREHIQAYLANTIAWTKLHQRDMADFIEGDFTTELHRQATNFGLHY